MTNKTTTSIKNKIAFAIVAVSIMLSGVACTTPGKDFTMTTTSHGAAQSGADIMRNMLGTKK